MRKKPQQSVDAPPPAIWNIVLFIALVKSCSAYVIFLPSPEEKIKCPAHVIKEETHQY